MKNLWIIANFKSHKTIAEALEWVSVVGPKLERRDNLAVVVCPPFVDLEEVKKAVMVGNYPMMVGAQDLSPFPEGAYTGEEAAKILKDVVELSILGHSERRKNFGETDEVVAQKVGQAIENNIIPLVCVQDQATPVPEGVKVVAYEPIFAIGTGNPDTPFNANAVAEAIKQRVGSEMEVLYGGSVNEENCKAFLEQEAISGCLIATASLDPQQFLRIMEVVYQQSR